MSRSVAVNTKAGALGHDSTLHFHLSLMRITLGFKYGLYHLNEDITNRSV